MKLKLDRKAVAEVLEEIATLLELKGENPFKIRAYFNAARTLEGLEGDLASLIEKGALTEIKGIGSGLSEAITQLATHGKLKFHDDIRAEFPGTLFDLFKVPGLGPKKIRALYEKLQITSLGELDYACQENRLVKLDGFGAKTQEKILQGIEYVKRNLGRFLYSEAIGKAELILQQIASWTEVENCSLAGSIRRCKEVVKDVDLLCASGNPEAVMEQFVCLEGVTNVVARGETKSTVMFDDGIRADLRVVKVMEFPYALHHFTGSKEHNTAMRARAKQVGLRMNEYGLFKEGELIPCASEKEIFRALGLSFIPPEMREDLGELEAAERNEIPVLLDADDLRGTFHVHTTYSDGRSTLAEIVGFAAKMGLEYVGIADHSRSAFYAGGLKEADLERQHKEIDELRKKHPKLRIFWGIESDILPDGSLDYPATTLKEFDFVIASVHSNFGMTEEEMTRRCLKAIENPYCTMIGHPTGRLLLARDGFKINLHRLIDRAAELGKVIELNANPQRLDLDWRLLPYAKAKGVRVSINPDAHSLEGMLHIRYGVNIARKGGLTKNQVFNTLPLAQMEKALAETRR